MWNRSEVKSKGKESFKRNYWKSVAVGLIYSLFFASSGAAYRQNQDEINSSVSSQLAEDPNAVAILLIVLAIIGVLAIILIVADVFVLNPLEVGCNRFFLVNGEQNAELHELGHAFKNNYINVVLGIFVRNLVISVGLVLFLIPGLILAYAYRLVPYILAEEPGISAIEALKKSRFMMKGQKWASFVYDLSFIGWYLLEAVTCGLVGVFYVNPYKLSSDAELYRQIKQNWSQPF